MIKIFCLYKHMIFILTKRYLKTPHVTYNLTRNSSEHVRLRSPYRGCHLGTNGSRQHAKTALIIPSEGQKRLFIGNLCPKGIRLHYSFSHLSHFTLIVSCFLVSWCLSRPLLPLHVN